MEWEIPLETDVVKQLENGDFLVLMTGGDWPIYSVFVCVSPEGKEKWRKRCANFVLLQDVELTADGGCVAAGWKGVWEPGPTRPGEDISFYDSGDYVVLKLGPDFEIPPEAAAKDEGKDGGKVKTEDGFSPLFFALACVGVLAALFALIRFRSRRRAKELERYYRELGFEV